MKNPINKKMEISEHWEKKKLRNNFVRCLPGYERS